MAADLTRVEEDVLLLLETALVEQRGMVRGKFLRHDDFVVAERWGEAGFITFRRIPYREANSVNKHPEGRDFGFTHYVQFTEATWQQAAAIRRSRAELSTPTLLPPAT